MDGMAELDEVSAVDADATARVEKVRDMYEHRIAALEWRRQRLERDLIVTTVRLGIERQVAGTLEEWLAELARRLDLALA